MEYYTDVNGDSGVRAFEIGRDYILVEFKTGAVYEYTSLSAGRQNLDRMGQLARSGDGLNSFIKKVVPKGYSRRIR